MWGRGITVASHVLWHVDVIYTPGIANTALEIAIIVTHVLVLMYGLLA